MDKPNTGMHKLLAAGGALLLMLLSVQAATAQPIIGARNLGLGGGGTAYLSGLDAIFYNPANLAIRDRESRVHLGFGQVSLFYEPVLSSEHPGRQLSTFDDIFSPYEPGSQTISLPQRETIVRENYPRNKLIAQHQSRSDVLIGGVTYQWDDDAFSVAARGRIGSHIETGRGWYDAQAVTVEGGPVRDMSVIQREQMLYELSFAYSRRFDFVSGLTPRINQLYVGIAPKFIMGGAYQEIRYRARYTDDGAAPLFFAYEFEHRSSGSYSQMVQNYLASGNVRQSINNTLSNDFYLAPTGFGFGLDFGLTYLIPLGDDLAFIQDSQNGTTTGRSIRFALSVSDIGFISYSDSPLQFSSGPEAVQIGDEPALDEKFIGAAGQFLGIIDGSANLPNPYMDNSPVSQKSFSVLLPTSLNAGVMIDLNVLRAMGDLTLGLQNTAFTNTKLEAHFGVEAFPVSRIPLRLGTRLAAGLPIRFGVGTGYISRHWELSLSTQILTKASSLSSELVGGAIAGLQFHF